MSALHKASAQAIFRGEDPGNAPCQWCGGLHFRGATPPALAPGLEFPVGVKWNAACPRIRKMEFHANGNLTSVEFFQEWDESGVVFPEDAFDPDDDARDASSG